jgi:hypothetical protein
MRRGAVRRYGLATVLLLVAVGIVGTSTNAAVRVDGPPVSSARIHERASLPHSTAAVVTIGGTSYTLVNGSNVIARIPSPYAKLLAAAIKLCGAAGFYGLVNSSAVGLIAWTPTNPLSCLTGAAGGGPGTTEGPCAQTFRTPDRSNFVLFAGTNSTICAHLSTQAPGGWATYTKRAAATVPTGSQVRVKCQRWYQGVLWDYVATPVSSLPVSRNAAWIQNSFVTTGVGLLRNTPKCNGVNFSF